MNAIVPISQVELCFRVATMADLPFLDALQKKHSKALGYFPTKQFEGYIEMGGVLVAWASRPCSAETDMAGTAMLREERVGYVISRDRYLKRDELGVVYQLCVAPGYQRGLIGATLIKAVFERSAYGCKLYCCWCAQDLDANYFWESLGFVPIAFRAGSTGKKRVHIFWQRRITNEATPWWYPCQTNGGAIRADRLVFPIPPGVHWRDIRPPDVHAAAVPSRDAVAKALPSGERATAREKRARKPIVPVAAVKEIAAGGLRFAAPQPAKEEARRAAAAKTPRIKTPPVKTPPVKLDPKLITAARELRDRYLERVNADDRLVLPATTGKYEVSRSLPSVPNASALPLLKAG